MAPQPAFLSKLKVHLKLSIQRLRMTQQRDESLSKQSRRAMAELLDQHKIASARIRTENIIRSDLLTELHEMLELYCELLLARSGLLENQDAIYSGRVKSPGGKEAVVPLEDLDSGIYEAVVVIVHAAPRTDIKELQTVRQLLIERYGRPFAEEAMRDEKNVVPDRVKRKLRVEPPGDELVESYLKAIAAAYDVPYGTEMLQMEEEEANPGDDNDDDEDPGEGGIKESIEVGAPGGPKGHAGQDEEGERATNRNLEDAKKEAVFKESTPSPPRLPAGAKSPVSIAPPSPRTDNANPRVKVPPGPTELKSSDKMKKATAAPTGKKPDEKKSEDTNGPGGKVPDVDDLEARFKLLKR
ncbi:MAG: hypothetical protein Q9159_001008 [Coniocarpon cinnabarinum]